MHIVIQKSACAIVPCLIYIPKLSKWSLSNWPLFFSCIASSLCSLCLTPCMLDLMRWQEKKKKHTKKQESQKVRTVQKVWTFSFLAWNYLWWVLRYSDNVLFDIISYAIVWSMYIMVCFRTRLFMCLSIPCFRWYVPLKIQ